MALDDKFFRRLAKELMGHEWESLATDLDFRKSEIEHFKADNQSTLDQIFAMLVEWRSKQKEDAAAEILMTALETVGRRDLAQQLRVVEMARKFFRRLAKELMGHEWESLATVLDFRKSEIEHFKADNQSTLDQIFAMLVEWRRKQKEDAAAEILMTALETVGRRDLAQQLRGRPTLSEPTAGPSAKQPKQATGSGTESAPSASASKRKRSPEPKKGRPTLSEPTAGPRAKQPKQATGSGKESASESASASASTSASASKRKQSPKPKKAMAGKRFKISQIKSCSYKGIIYFKVWKDSMITPEVKISSKASYFHCKVRDESGMPICLAVFQGIQEGEKCQTIWNIISETTEKTPVNLRGLTIEKQDKKYFTYGHSKFILVFNKNSKIELA